jgi:hypothetical protein
VLNDYTNAIENLPEAARDFAHQTDSQAQLLSAITLALVEIGRTLDGIYTLLARKDS